MPLTIAETGPIPFCGRPNALWKAYARIAKIDAPMTGFPSVTPNLITFAERVAEA